MLTIFAHTEIEKIGATMCQPDFFFVVAVFLLLHKKSNHKKHQKKQLIILAHPTSFNHSLCLRGYTLCLWSQGLVIGREG